MKYFWRKKLLSTTYDFFIGDNHIGNMLAKTLTYSSTATFESLKLLFHTEGLFSQTTKIISTKDEKVLGKITYDGWRKRGYAEIEGEHLEWRSTNMTGSNWVLMKNESIITHSRNSWTDGEIISESDAPLYFLTGMYISDYFNRSNTAVFTALFILFILVII